ncbi:MAG: phenylalanine--tRNA ligase subunit beta [bacterium]|nr:phenylalanine--tRNA ligase subunit beta [bacterium]
MRFSYSLLKQFVPALKSSEHLKDVLTAHLFEVESIDGDTVDIKVLPNRYSDCASHIGIAREVAAALGKPLKLPKASNAESRASHVEAALDLVLSVKERVLCPRYMARYFEIDANATTPEWMKRVLASCGMRPINPVVDIMNYAMLEVGQPMHAFDADKIKNITIRRAEAKEKIETLDGNHFTLTPDDLVIADGAHVLGIAGIKGGKRAEVTASTTRIVVEAATFDSVALYKTSKRLKLVTDASQRFTHRLSSVMPQEGMLRVTELLINICHARVGEVVDFYPKKMKPAVLRFTAEEFNALSGMKLTLTQALGYLKRLGFEVRGEGKLTKVVAPARRTDIERFEDLVEEIVRLVGYDKLPSTPPAIALTPAVHDDAVSLKALIRQLLPGAGLTEAYNYSFVSEKDIARAGTSDGAVALQNPVSAEFAYLRPTLAGGLLKNIESNFRFSDTVRIFEIGKVFVETKGKVSEHLALGIALGAKHASPLLELKGIISELLDRLGLMEHVMRDVTNVGAKYLNAGESMCVESDHRLLGIFGAVPQTLLAHAAIAEIDLGELTELVVGEREYEPIAKYPSIARDISVLIPRATRVGDILEEIQAVSPKFVYDVDLIDYFEDEAKMRADQKSLTFRIVFQANDHTLTDDEVGREMEKIVHVLRDRLFAEVR